MIEIVPNWHPIWVHFTIGLLIIGTLFYALAVVGAAKNWSNQALSAARWNLIAGVLFAVLSLASGYLAANSVPHDNAGHANLLVHINWALIAAAIFVMAVVWLSIQWRTGGKASVAVLVLLLAGSAALGMTGFKGGANVFEHGLGVQRLPDLEAHDHAAHDHEHPGKAEEHDGHEEGMSHQALPEEEKPEDASHEDSSDVHIHSDGSEHHH